MSMAAVIEYVCHYLMKCVYFEKISTITWYWTGTGRTNINTDIACADRKTCRRAARGTRLARYDGWKIDRKINKQTDNEWMLICRNTPACNEHTRALASSHTHTHIQPHTATPVTPYIHTATLTRRIYKGMHHFIKRPTCNIINNSGVLGS